MKFTNNSKNCFLILVLCSVLNVFGQGKANKFTIVLDAGHGGKDPGNSYHGYVEKDIALKTTLKVGEFLEKEKDFEVVFTRKTDVFIELVNRPKVANKINANLFVSIHCNSVKNFEPEGTETFVMGLSRANMNLEVAKNENSVILLEENYKKTYEGFDPKKPETFIGLKLVQEENLNSSITLASSIQENFTNNLNRKTRGVKQQPLWVLDAAYMPGVLIELGFLSNAEEGEFLNSDEGQTKMAHQIAEAIIKYKKEYFSEPYAYDESKMLEKIAKAETKAAKTEAKEEVKETKLEPKTEGSGAKGDPKTEVKVAKVEPKESKKEPKAIKTVSKDSLATKPVKEEPILAAAEEDGMYKIQLFASSKKKEVTSPDFKGLKEISFTYEHNLYKYYYGKSSDLEGAKKSCQEAKRHGFKDAFIVQFAAGKGTAIK
jgi:N-acetylmuramoyl-L-alanine amidase